MLAVSGAGNFREAVPAVAIAGTGSVLQEDLIMVQILTSMVARLIKRCLKPPDFRTFELQRDWQLTSRGNDFARLLAAGKRLNAATWRLRLTFSKIWLERDGHIFPKWPGQNALLTLDWSIEPPPNATAEEKQIGDGGQLVR